MIYTILVHVLIKKAKKDMATYLLILYISFFRTLPYKHIDVQRLASHSRNMTFHIKWSCIHFRSIQLSRFFDFSTVFFSVPKLCYLITAKLVYLEILARSCDQGWIHYICIRHRQYWSADPCSSLCCTRSA